MVFAPFRSENGIEFPHFGLESGMIFEGTTYGSVWTQLSFQFQMNKKEKVICEFEMNFKKSFCLRSKLNEDDKISSRPALKRGMDLVGRNWKRV